MLNLFPQFTVDFVPKVFFSSLQSFLTETCYHSKSRRNVHRTAHKEMSVFFLFEECAAEVVVPVR